MATVHCLHLLVKHAGSRRPASWKEDPITRSAADARAILETHIEALSAGRVDFGDLASRESDCSSAQRGGDLGPFALGAMQKPFEDAAFALEVGQMSGVVDTESGLHIIKRIA